MAKFKGLEKEFDKLERESKDDGQPTFVSERTYGRSENDTNYFGQQPEATFFGVLSGILVIAVFIVAVIAIIYARATENTAVAIFGAVVFGGLILIYIGITLIKLLSNYSGIEKNPAAITEKAQVISCRIAMQSEVGNRVNITYVVGVMRDNGSEMSVKSKNRAYTEGEVITVKFVPQKPKYGIVVNNDEQQQN